MSQAVYKIATGLQINSLFIAKAFTENMEYKISAKKSYNL